MTINISNTQAKQAIFELRRLVGKYKKKSPKLAKELSEIADRITDDNKRNLSLREQIENFCADK